MTIITYLKRNCGYQLQFIQTFRIVDDDDDTIITINDIDTVPSQHLQNVAYYYIWYRFLIAFIYKVTSSS